MKYPARIWLLLIVALLLEPHCLPRSTEQPPEQAQLQLGVRFYNHARISDGELKAARKVVAHTLSESGIHLDWTACDTNQATSGGGASLCDPPARATDLVLYFVGSFDHTQSVDGKALGYSIILSGNQLSTMAYISYTRVQTLSAFTSVDVTELLGLAVAHEIGHLLLGTHSHASQGIMRPTWGLRDIERRGWELNFTPDQLRQLRASVQTRLRLDEVQPNYPQGAGALPGSRWTDQPHTRYPLCR